MVALIILCGISLQNEIGLKETSQLFLRPKKKEKEDSVINVSGFYLFSF